MLIIASARYLIVQHALGQWSARSSTHARVGVCNCANARRRNRSHGPPNAWAFSEKKATKRASCCFGGEAALRQDHAPISNPTGSTSGFWQNLHGHLTTPNIDPTKVTKSMLLRAEPFSLTYSGGIIQSTRR